MMRPSLIEFASPYGQFRNKRNLMNHILSDDSKVEAQTAQAIRSIVNHIISGKQNTNGSHEWETWLEVFFLTRR